MGRLGLALLRAYLACIAYFAPNRLRVRQELALIEYSLVESYESERSRHGTVHAAWASVRRHLNELWPPSLASKARSECTHVARDRRYPLRIASGVGSLAAVAIVGFLALAPNTEAPAVSGVARVLPDGDPRAGQVEVIAEDVQTLQEGIYIASGGRVCIDPSLTGADLTDEIINTSSTLRSSSVARITSCRRSDAGRRAGSLPRRDPQPLRAFLLARVSPECEGDAEAPQTPEKSRRTIVMAGLDRLVMAVGIRSRPFSRP